MDPTPLRCPYTVPPSTLCVYTRNTNTPPPTPPPQKKKNKSQVLDKTGMKGTGRWTIQEAAERNVPATTIAAALDARYLR